MGRASVSDTGRRNRLYHVEAVGRALTQWERFEQIFCTLFCTLLGRDTNYAAERAYGAVITFRGRADMIEAIVENYFSLHRSKKLKALFRGLMNRAKNYGARRNEIAHGQVGEWNFGGRKKGWLLVPSRINTNKNSLVDHSKLKIAPRLKVARTKPKYLYSSVEIHEMADEFDGLALAAFSLVADILSAEGRRAFGP